MNICRFESGGISVTAGNKYVYKINLANAGEIREFTKIAANCPYDVYVVNGRHRLNAKSYLGVILARVSWDEMSIESEEDCYFAFEKFIR